MPDFNQQIIEEFRANGGRVGGWLAGSRLLLLTTTGARSGAPHTVPVGYLPDGERQLVIGSAGGSPRHPAWYHNLVAHPDVDVELRGRTRTMHARVATGEERERLWSEVTRKYRNYADYQRRTRREIPVVVLDPR